MKMYEESREVSNHSNTYTLVQKGLGEKGYLRNWYHGLSESQKKLCHFAMAVGTTLAFGTMSYGLSKAGFNEIGIEYTGIALFYTATNVPGMIRAMKEVYHEKQEQKSIAKKALYEKRLMALARMAEQQPVGEVVTYCKKR